ncbi:pentapeptide repeat-containing protein, partial [Salmonella enterica]|nr:pentapeptide repeat-containing protein [Salmonella enterica]
MNMPVYAEQKFTLDQFTGKKISDAKFYACDFSETDLTETQFVNCHFWHPDKQVGCDFSGATLKEACFVNCDLTMSIFKNADLFGIEIRECRAMGCNFRLARFMKKISPRLWLCSAYITKSNLSYADFSGVILVLYWKSVNFGKISGTRRLSQVPISVGQIFPEGILRASAGVLLMSRTVTSEELSRVN